MRHILASGFFAFCLTFGSGLAHAADWSLLAAAANAPAPVSALPDIEWRDTIGPGERSPRVAEIRAVLEAYGAAPEDPIDAFRFDPELASSMRALQSRLGFAPTGEMTPSLMDRLLGAAGSDGAMMKAAALAGPVSWPATSVRVSIAAREVAFFRDGEEVLSSRAIIGSPAHPTPEFSSNIGAITFNPPWNVPNGIKARKIVPNMKKDPAYLARNRIDIIDPSTGATVSRETALADPLRYRYRQRPGPFNSLGAIKLEMPNAHTVYLHDTPERELFESEDLRRSSGCVRVEKIEELARALLGQEIWEKENISARLATGSTFRVNLPASIPVILYYRTAEPFAGGVRINGDPYGRIAGTAGG